LRSLIPGPRRQSDGPAWNAGIYLTFPFFDGLRSRGRTQQARSDLRTSQLQEQKLRDSIALELRTARYNLAESAETITALSGTVKQAERLLQMAEKGFEYGVKTRLEVDDAQTNLLRAQSNLARANRDYLAASVNLLWAMGMAGEQEL
jgi:Outer membrane protein